MKLIKSESQQREKIENKIVKLIIPKRKINILKESEKY